MVLGLYFCGEYEAAIEAAGGVIRSYPDHPLIYRWLAASLGQIGRIQEAKEALEKAIAVVPGSFDMYVRGRVPWMRPEDHDLPIRSGGAMAQRDQRGMTTVRAPPYSDQNAST